MEGVLPNSIRPSSLFRAVHRAQVMALTAGYVKREGGREGEKEREREGEKERERERERKREGGRESSKGL